MIASSPDRFNEIANHPRVYPAISFDGCGPIDFSPIWDDCVGVEFDSGGWVFHRREPGVYEVHTLFLPKTRGVDAMADEALGYMFDREGAELVLTQVTADLPHVRRLAERHGFKWFDSAPGAWMRNGVAVDVDFFELTHEAWRERQGCPQQQL